ncbi:spore cortex-lytic enzyme [Alicyclobacillus sp.]|uniref:spore cortex-lytic enzyme n=1 Tax=Alicyclobacillus sp. TaxID=61169 RepID=UPI0025C25354|nr:spore cortex-lytic enzyme [Alicyclobacillus sp.]
MALGLWAPAAWHIPHQPWRAAEAFTPRDLRYGSEGYDVYELQNRLAYLGYYHGHIDGIFGWKTYWAVRNFQYNFGMKVTGIVDMKTKMKLVAASKGWHYKGPLPDKGAAAKGATGASRTATRSASPARMPSVPGLSQSDLNLLTHVVYAEARGEPYVGQVAVAAVVLNRLHDPRFPHTIPGIVYQPGAFTSVQDGQINLQPDATARKAVLDAVHGWDPSHGAVYYFNPDTATSDWIWSRPQILKIGKHIFTK